MNSNKIHSLFYLFAVSWALGLAFPQVSAAGVPQMAVGVNFPGLSGRYFPTELYAVELKGQFEKDVLVGGVRGYRYFRSVAGVKPFAGVELDYVNFKGEVSEGPGFAAELFVGGEYFFTETLSAQLDFGPAYVQLTDSDTTSSVGGIEYVVNLGINWYFRGN